MRYIRSDDEDSANNLLINMRIVWLWVIWLTLVDTETDYRSFSSGCETLPIGARRAVSNIDDNVEWYKKIFAASILHSSKQIIVDEYVNEYGNKVKYAYIKLYLSEDSTTVSFFERNLPDNTYGDFTILDFAKTGTDTIKMTLVIV